MKLIWILIWLGWLLPSVVAHPADVLVQAAYITISPTKIRLELDLTAGELVAKNFLSKLDLNQNAMISPEEVRQFSSHVLEQLTLEVNQKPILLQLESSQIPEIAQVKLGGGQVQLVFVGAPIAVGQNQLVFKNSFAPVKSAYLANVFVQSSAVKIISQQRDQTQQTFDVRYSITESAFPRVFAWWLGLIPVLGLVAWRFFRVPQKKVNS
jgi:hypothetical protein